MALPYLLTIIVFLPVLGALVIALLPGGQARTVKLTAIIFSGATLALAVLLFVLFDRSNPQMQFVNRAPWIPQLGIEYFLGIDGLSVVMVFLTGLLFFLAVLVSWKIEHRVREYFALVMALEMGVLGVFTALDFFLFFLFWEVELVPMYLLIAIWGSGRREYSAMKFLIYTMLGSAAMLVGILWIYFGAYPEGQRTFDMLALGQADLAPAFQMALFFLLFIGFAIKLPVVPFHTWLPDAHVDAPTAVSVILAGVLLKMGGYGMIRITVSILPEAAQTLGPLLIGLGVVNVLYGAGTSMVQRDLKKMVAYSSVSSMGYVLLGIGVLTQVGLSGATLQMFTHGLYSGMLFALVGVVYDKAHTRQIADFGGLAQRMPLVAVLFSIAGLAALGLPGLAPFVSEFLVFVGSFREAAVATGLAAAGIVLTAGYILWMIQRVFFGPFNPRWEHLGDATVMEAVPLVIFAGGLLVFGLFPSILTNVIYTGVLPVVQKVGLGS